MKILDTDRLTIRHLTTRDAAFMVALLNDEDFIRHIGDRGVRTNAEAVTYLKNGPLASYRKFGHGLYRVSISSSRTPIGICGLVRREGLPEADLGFAFLPDYRQQGYAFEASKAVLDYARDTLHLRQVLAIVNPTNPRSIVLLEKLGFADAGTVQLKPGDPELRLFRIALTH